MRNKEKIILDLCGGTGSWSRPYKEAGYDVKLITLPEWDIRRHRISNNQIQLWRKGYNGWVEVVETKNVYGILAAPPCTMFSFARTNAKRPRDTKEGMECVRACLNIIWSCMEVQQSTSKKTLPLQFWALENPYHGFLKKFLSKPAFIFDPWEFGDGYQKKTAIWGCFNEPIKNPIPMTKGVKFDYLKSKDIHPEVFGKFDRQTRRSITPQGFAKAFFEANR